MSELAIIEIEPEAQGALEQDVIESEDRGHFRTDRRPLWVGLCLSIAAPGHAPKPRLNVCDSKGPLIGEADHLGME